jgi:hypothetical protein
MSVRHESQGRVTTVILDHRDGRSASAAEVLTTDLATRGGSVGPGTGRHRAPVA